MAKTYAYGFLKIVTNTIKFFFRFNRGRFEQKVKNIKSRNPTNK